ncbi:methanogenesis marker 6 protein [Methanococcus voltae]|uniref:methanogenesis marker 6 protein n=1 Tax=Methanococcus voltae TaxID=2188 RepID=UPI001AE59AE5|nr:methanogenesis marker 6 protein [Methanococcus voltae]MBP2172481.1 putative methanogenesis marker protein 6 [Methanococcus voltae]
MKSKVIMLADDAKTSPSKLFRYLNSLEEDINVKETCFGAFIEGEDELVDKIADKVRDLEKNKIFCKDRGFPIWDKRRCRAFRKGGPREGFHQLEAEHRALKTISEGLDEYESEKSTYENVQELKKKVMEEYDKTLKKSEKVSVGSFAKIAEEYKSDDAPKTKKAKN